MHKYQKSRLFSLAAAVMFTSSCGMEEPSSTQEAANISQSQALNAAQSIVVDLSTNRACYRENGESKTCWNVGTGRDYRRNSSTHPASGDLTPTGTYFIHQIEVCPKYFPREGQAIGPCNSKNPLGTRALWFRAGRLYGLHGTSAPHLLERENRRISGGCVRNRNSQIEWVYEKIRSNFGRPISSWEAKTVANPKRGRNVPVVVGKFKGKYDNAGGVLQDGHQISKSCKIIAEDVNVRSAPSVQGSSMVDNLPKGTGNLHAIMDFGDWYQVAYNFRGRSFNKSNPAFIKKSYNGRSLISCR